MMLRFLYTVLLRFHPKQFRARFGSEMLLTFEEARETDGSLRLVLDAVLSLFRQHFLRPRAKHRQQALAGVTHLSNSPQLGLSPYRLFQGGLISLALFVVVCLSIRGGRTVGGAALIGHNGAAHGQPLTPSDLATIYAPGSRRALAVPDELKDLQLPTTRDEDAHELLLPSGPLGIGRILYRWIENADPAAGRSRAQQRLVFVWYPSFPDRQSTAKRFASDWNYSRANRLLVETHTIEKPSIVSGSNLFPVLLFYPSMNSSSAAYTTQIENLVSHGYVVASIEPHIDRSVVSFTNAQLLPFASELRRAYRADKNSTLERALAEGLLRERSLAGDLSFVLDRLTVMNRASRDVAPFAWRLDLSKIGAFGHSDGGTAAGLACQLDQRIGACLSEDGWTPNGPDPRIESAKAQSRPFMWINIPLAAPENGQLAYLYMRRNEFDSLARRSQMLANEELNSLQHGAYRITIRLPEVTDNFFTDGPFVWSMLHPRGSVAERNVLVIVNTYTRAFFDHYLRSGPKQLLDASALPLRNVEVRQYRAVTQAKTPTPR